MRRDDLRNIVIIAHVDHGKTTLVDCLLRQSGQFRDSQLTQDCILDSNDQERERGITILAKNIALPYKGVKINIVDTPGHADFGGEVERVLQMADGAVVLVDAAEGPMPQTRFVLGKALECGLQPIVVVNKIDRPDARSLEALDEVFELLLELGGDDLSDFPYIYATSKEGYATDDPTKPGDSMEPLLDLVLKYVPGPEVELEDPLQMLVTTLDWSEFVGRIAVGRIRSGSIKKGQTISLMQAEGVVDCIVAQLYVFENLGRVEVDEAKAGDICAIVGLENVEIGDTVCDRDHQNALPRIEIDKPTLEMVFTINSSPLAGKEGKFVTSRQLRERLYKELERNVALHVSPVEGADAYAVSGRGLLHLSVLIESMRREGFELSIGKPQVILRENNRVLEEPYETLVVDVRSDKIGPVMEMVGERRGELVSMDGRGDYTQIEFDIPSRGLIGMETRLKNATQGEVIVTHRFNEYRPVSSATHKRVNGAMVSMVNGKAVAFGLEGLQQRGVLFVSPGDEVYEGMVVGEHAKDNDLVVNPIKEKKLTNMRASGTDANILLTAPRKMALEAALEYIEEDELVEITPTKIRIRKIRLKESERRRQSKQRLLADNTKF